MQVTCFATTAQHARTAAFNCQRWQAATKAGNQVRRQQFAQGSAEVIMSAASGWVINYTCPIQVLSQVLPYAPHASSKF
jgi:hypothetical protein